MNQLTVTPTLLFLQIEKGQAHQRFLCARHLGAIGRKQVTFCGSRDIPRDPSGNLGLSTDTSRDVIRTPQAVSKLARGE